MKYKTQRSMGTGKLNSYVTSHKGIAVRIMRFESHPRALNHMTGIYYWVYIGIGNRPVEFNKLAQAKAFVLETLGA